MKVTLRKQTLGILVVIIISTAVFVINAGAPQSWTIDGDRVYVDDVNVFIQAAPHTMYESGWVYFNFTSKVYTGDVDVVWGFNTSSLKPKQAQLYSPWTSNETRSFTCGFDYFNYTWSGEGHPDNRYWCWSDVGDKLDDANGTTTELVLMRDGWFEWGNIPAATAYWNITTQHDYREISGQFSSVDYDYSGMTKWWYKKYVPIQQDVGYQVRVWIDVPVQIGENSGKYWFAIKPSGETIQQAIASGHLYYLDPWWNTGYDYRYEVLFNTSSAAEYALPVNGIHGVDGEIVWARMDNSSETVYVYSKNSGPTWEGAIAIATGTTEKFWENETSHEGNNITAVWDDGTGNTSMVLHMDELTAIDSVAGVNNCTAAVGDPAVTEQGVFGSSIAFDGDDHIDCGNDPSVLNLNMEFTLSAWVWWNGTVNAQVFSNFPSGGGAGTQMYNSGGALWWFVYRPGGDGYVNANCAGWSTGKWWYLTAVHNYTGLFLYRDAVLCANTADTDKAVTSGTEQMWIGEQVKNSQHMDGQIDEARIYQTDKSETWITQQYSDGMTALGGEELLIIPLRYTNNFTQFPTPQTYGLGRDYGFQINWDEVDNVTFEADFEGTNTNYTMYGTVDVHNISTATYWINFTQDNMTAGSHSYKWYAANLTDENATEAVIYLIEGANSTCTVAPSTQTITYFAAVNQYCTVNVTDDNTCTLWVDNVNVTDDNDTSVIYGEGTHAFVSNYTAGINHTVCPDATSTLTVDANTTGEIDMWLNDTENADYTATWPADVNATCVINRTTENAFTMLLAGASVGSQVGDAIEYNDDLAAGTYNVTCHYDSANYSDTQHDQSFTLNAVGTDLNVSINDTTDPPTDQPYMIWNGSIVNYTIVTNSSAEVALQIDYDGCIVTANDTINNQTAPYENFTATNCTTLNLLATPNIWGIIDNTNYTYVKTGIEIKFRDVLKSSDTYTDDILESENTTISVTFDIPLAYDSGGYPEYLPTAIGANGTNLIATLIWNDTVYGNTSSSLTGASGGWDNITLSATFAVPNISQNTTTVDFYWNYSYDGVKNRTTSPITQTIAKPMLLNCGELSNTTAVIIRFYNETNPFVPINSTLVNMVFNFTLDSTNYVYNATNTTTNSTLADPEQHQICIYPTWMTVSADASIDYTLEGSYPLRTYFLNNATLSNDTSYLNLYLLATARASRITFTIRDATGNVQPAVFVQVHRFYNELDDYKVVTVMKTDNAGKSVAYLEAYDVGYKFVIVNSVGTILHIIEDMEITSSDMTLTLPEAEVIAYFDYYDNLAYSCSYGNATRNLTCTVTDTSGLMTQSCLQAWFKGALSDTEVCNECSTAVSSTLVCGLPSQYNGTYVYQVMANISSDVDFVILTKEFLHVNIPKSIFGPFGLFVAMLLIGTMTFAGLYIHPVIAVLMMGGTLGLVTWFGLVNTMWDFTATIVLIGVIIIYRVRSR